MGAIERSEVDAPPPAILIEQAEKFVAAHQPELKVSIWKSWVVIEGQYILTGPLGEFDSFDVKIGIPAGFPVHEPIIFEEGGRIERVADRHVFEDDGNCCVGVYEEWLLRSQNHNLENFMLGPVDDYFFGQYWYEAKLIETGKGEWPLGERSHGLAGVLETYGDILDLDIDRAVITSHLRVLARETIKGHFSCPCGSGKRLRHCHRDVIESLRLRINPTMAKRMLDNIEPKKIGDPANS